MFGAADGGLAPVDLAREKRLLDTLLGAIGSGLIESCHGVAEGGLAVAVAEACFNPDRPAGAEIDGLETFEAAELFGEGPSTLILSAKDSDLSPLSSMFAEGGIECRVIGRVTAQARLRFAASIDEEVRELSTIYERALPGRL